MDSRVVWDWLARRHVHEYGIGVVAALVAITIRTLFDPIMDNRLPFGTALLAVVIVAWFSGFRAAIVALLIGLPACVFLFVPPRGTLWMPELEFRIAAGMYLFIGLTVALFSESQRRAQAHAEQQATAAQMKQIELEREIAGHKRTQQRLLVSERRKDEFLAMLAHELRSPLAPISNALQLLRVATEEQDKQWACQVMQRQMSQMNRLVNDLLDVSRISEGKIKLQIERASLSDIVEMAVETVEPFVRAQGHQLSVVLPDRPVILSVDPARMAQVVSNLLNNAAKYMEQGGHIWLSTRLAPTSVELRVRDEGIGTAAEDLNRVFELFTQSDGALHRSHGGLGIGLTLVRAIVELHGGRVTAKSDGPGCGSEFVVSLPCLSANPPEFAPNPQTGLVAIAPAKQLP